MAALAALLAVLAGLAGSVQVAIMGRLGQRVGSVEAVAWATVLSSVLAVVALLVVRQSLHGLVDSARQPPWLWLGALMGTFIVFTITFAGPRIGTTATIGVLIAGQLAMGAVIDRFGLFGLEKIPLDAPRTIGILLLAAGAVLTLRK